MRRCLLVTLMLTVVALAERINHEGRILGPPPVVTSPTLFNTPAADDIVAAMQIMPVAYDAAVFHVTLTTMLSRSGNDEITSFPTAAGHHYRVEHSDDLTIWSTLSDNIAGTGGTLHITHSGAFVAPRHFYRVLVLD